MTGKTVIKKYTCIHGHFYQPFRGNPWIGEIDLQDEAYPYKDWNERISAECYNANAFARILDGKGKIKSIFNNYSRISFNFGSTLLAWLKKNEYDTYEKIIKADYESKELYSGHGSAIAQSYNHIIMPLANRNDKILQVSWSIYDFEKHFGRKPEGMWLAETAVDYDTLEILADSGIKYTILSPYQALRYRKIDSGNIKNGSDIINSNHQKDWIDVPNGTINARKPYLCRLPSGKSMSIFFYDKDISTSVSFGDLLKNGDEFASNIIHSVSLENDEAEITVIASDGEAYGHHKKFGEMALAYCLNAIEKSSDIQLTVFGEYLEKFPPDSEVEIIEKTAWSCSHFLTRWEGGCSCGMPQNPPDGKWSQEWRATLREAINFLRNKIDEIYSLNIKKYIKKDIENSFEVLEKYIDVISNRNTESINKFLLNNSQDFKNTNLENKASFPYIHDYDYGANERMLLSLTEMQRQAMLMQSSDAWFFDDISRVEVIQVLSHALRAIELATLFSDENIENTFIEILRNAKSNILNETNGADIYLKEVSKKRYSIDSVAIHFIFMISMKFISNIFSGKDQNLLQSEFGYKVIDFYEHEIKITNFNHYISNNMITVYGEISIISKINLEKSSYFFIGINDNSENYATSNKRELFGILLKQETDLSEKNNENFKKDPGFKYYDLKDINDRLKVWFFDEYMLVDIKKAYEDLKLYMTYKKAVPDSLTKWMKFKSDALLEDEFKILMDNIKIFIFLNSDRLDRNEIDELELLVNEYKDMRAVFPDLLPEKYRFFFSSLAKQDKALNEMLVLYKKNPFDGLLLSLIIRLIKIYEKLGLDLDYWNIQNTLFEIKENIKNIKISSKEDALLYLNDDMKNNLVFLFDFFKINPDL